MHKDGAGLSPNSGQMRQEVTNGLHSKLDFPDPPLFLSRLDQAVDHPQRFVDLLSQQQLLDNKQVLQLLNSPIFDNQQPITNLKQAVDGLGAESVALIIKTTVLQQRLETYIANLSGFWLWSKETAGMCALIAQELGLWSKHQAYVLGLFHNSGIAVLLKKYPNFMTVIREGYKFKDGLPAFYEERAIRTNHAIVGGLVMNDWQFSSELVDLIRLHHDRNSLFRGCGGLTDKLYMLKMAENFSNLHVFLGQQGVNHEWQLVRETVLAFLGLNMPAYNELKDLVRHRYYSEFV